MSKLHTVICSKSNTPIDIAININTLLNTLNIYNLYPSFFFPFFTSTCLEIETCAVILRFSMIVGIYTLFSNPAEEIDCDVDCERSVILIILFSLNIE